MPDQRIVCKDCQREFIFDEGEQAFFAAKKLTPPKRCHACRARKREERALAQRKNA
jgi:hypothetical protein